MSAIASRASRAFAVAAMVSALASACNDEPTFDFDAFPFDTGDAADGSGDDVTDGDTADVGDDGADTETDVTCPDDDSDGVCDADDICPDGNDAFDADRDGVPDGCDACAGFDDAIDTDADGIPNACDSCDGERLDADHDGVPDACDICPSGDDAADRDEDGVPDRCDRCLGADDALDDDRDGVPDACDACPDFDDAEDIDEDGTPDACDICHGAVDTDDSDGDGAPDGCDVCPVFDDRVDGDGDGIPNGCDVCDGEDEPDGDGDGVPNACDVCPGANDTVDGDGDGLPDACDPCPADASNDADGDGVCGAVDRCADGDDSEDYDEDGIPDACDPCPFDANNDSDGDLVCDSDDPCPNDATDDSDGDGICDGVDTCDGGDDLADRDGDDIPDACDGCPDDPGDDVDGDGLCGDDETCEGDETAGDSDGDGVCDDVDACPGHDDFADGDADGLPDGCDTCPALPGGDLDGDGLCDADPADVCFGRAHDDPDFDGDRVCSDEDICPTGDDRVDTDGDGTPDACDRCPGPDDRSDPDRDGIPDGCDACPDDAGSANTDARYTARVEAITFAPRPSPANELELADDEVVMLDLGFDYTFYGHAYRYAWLSANGFLTFDGGSDHGCCQGRTLGLNDDVDNVVAFFWEDLDPEAGGRVAWERRGTAPNREIVVAFEDVPYYVGSGGFPLPTPATVDVQVVLREGTGAAEVYCARCVPDGDGAPATQGVEGPRGIAPAFVAGRNAAEFTATNDARRFVTQREGDGVPDVCDACPGGNDDVDTDGDGTPDDCEVCGNGVIDAGEACDDGNRLDGDGCAADCSEGPAVDLSCVDEPLGSGYVPEAMPFDPSGDEELAGSCGGLPFPGPDTVFSWTAPETTTVQIALAIEPGGTLFPLPGMLYVRAGACDGAELACGTGDFTGLTVVELGVTAGRTYVIVADGLIDGETYALAIAPVGSP